MPLHRSRLLVLSLALPLLGVAGLSVGTVKAEDKPCLSKSFKISDVEAACKAGGQTAAKKLMKKATDKAKAAGEDVNCKTCHKDLKTFELTKASAVDDLKKWL